MNHSLSFRLVIFSSLALLSIIIFRNTDLDLWLTTQFYDGAAQQIWPYRNTLWVDALYESVAYISYLVLIFCFMVFVWAIFNSSVKPYRHVAILVLSVLIISPGLIVNVGFKEHFGRPRPYETLQFKGSAEFKPLLEYNAEGAGKYYSFPSGHSSVPFAFIAFWFALRKRHPKIARATLVTTLTFAAMVGMARIVAGGHYLSDVLWSGFFAYFVAEGLNYFLKSDQLLAKESSKITKKERTLVGVVFALLIYIAFWFSN